MIVNLPKTRRRGGALHQRIHSVAFVLSAVVLQVAFPGSASADDPALRPDAQPAPLTDKQFRDKARLLFDGHTVLGWEGIMQWFRVEDRCLVAGRLDQPIPHNQFLCTTEKFGDFELRLEAKLVGEGNNAGVQFRSKRVGGSSEVSGYQADIGQAWNRPVWGALYDESRRKKMLAEPDPETIKRVIKPGDWNQLRVVADGPRIQIFVNGTQTVDYTETDDTIERAGVIGLQIHSGKPL